MSLQRTQVLKKIKHLLVTGPSGRYYLVTDNDGMRILQYLFSKEFRVINFFVVDDSDLRVFAQDIKYYTETYIVNFDVASDQESSVRDCESDDLISYGYNSEELKAFSQ